MKYLIVLFSVIFLFSFSLEAQEERKVLVEVFTNSHCGQCPAAHNVIDNYLTKKILFKDNFLYFNTSEGTIFYYNLINKQSDFIKISDNMLPLIGTPLFINDSLYTVDMETSLYKIDLERSK